MPTTRIGDVDLYYETIGDRGAEPMLLIMGLGMQITGWDNQFYKMLANQGFFLIRFDNRDAGLSTKLEVEDRPDVVAIAAGDHRTLAYTLDDLADDATGLLDALGVRRAHIVGASMGGMVAQLIAIRHPERVASLTSMMATTGDTSVGYPTQEAVEALTATPSSAGREEVIDAMMRVWRTIGSHAFPLSDRQLRAFVIADYERSYFPEGAARQLAAVIAASDRTEQLSQLNVPTLVIHGNSDPLVDVSGGEATARAIPGARLLVIDGMAHDIPPRVWRRLVDAIATTAHHR